MKLSTKTTAVVLTLFGALVGCATVPLNPGAEQVTVSLSPPPSNCRLIGPIIAYEVNGSSIMYTTHEVLDARAMNKIRNRAISVGGNYVMVTERAHTYLKDRKYRQPGVIDTHHLAGYVYACPG